MDIVAPVLAYLTCVAGIVGAFLVSFYMVFAPPSRPAIAQHTAAIVSASTTKPVTAPAAEEKKPALRGAVADNPAVNHAVPTTQKREDAASTPAPRGTLASPRGTPAQAATPAVGPQKLAAGEIRGKGGKITRAQWRQIVEQERRHRLAYQQDADFKSRFLGYAD